MIQDNSFLQPLYLPVTQNRYLCVWLLCLHGLAITGIVLTGWPAVWKWTGVLFVVLHGLVQCYRQCIAPAARRVVAVALQTAADRGSAQWWLQLAASREQAQWLPARLMDDALIHPRCLVLRFRSELGCHRLLFIDSPDNAATLRRLRVRLRYPLAGEPLVGE